MRGIYGQNRYRVGTELDAPVELRDVSSSGGIWLGFFAFIGWSFAKSLSAGIDEVIYQVKSRK